MVLETTALPTELYPYTTGERFTNRFTRYGGEDGIRTHAALANPNDLANRPLQPLEYFSRLNVIVFGVLPNDNLRSAFGGEGGIRTHGPLRSHWFTRPAPKTTRTPLLMLSSRFFPADAPNLLIGDPSEVRTPDTLIKSQVLCQLS